MKSLLYIIFLLFSFSSFSQKNDELTVMANARSLHKAVFETRDSVVLVRLFSDKLSYGHSGGRLENKQEALKGIIQNKSVYEDLNLGPVSIWMNDKTAVTRYMMSANEKAKDGKMNLLKLHIVLVWIKEKKDWKLLARQAVRVN